MNYYILKSEPSTYSWNDLVKDTETAWTGVRNYQARNNLRAMKKGDICLFYHSGEEKSVVGVAKVSKEAYQDPTTTEPNWVCVDITPIKALEKHVSLATMKKHPTLSKMLLVRHSRLSAIPITADDYHTMISLQ